LKTNSKTYFKLSMDTLNKDFNLIQLQRLESIAQRSQEALELCASLGDYQTAVTKFKNRKDIYERAVQGLRQIVPIAFYAFFSTEDLQFDIELEHCDDRNKESYIIDTVDYLIEKGIVAQAFREKRTLASSTRDRKHTLLIHTLTTTSKIYGIFFCFLEKKPFEFNIVDKITTIIIKSTCYALENFELYQLIDKKNTELIEKNILLSKEIQTKEAVQARLRKSEIIYRNTFENTGNPTIIADSNGLITHSNSRFLEFCGCDINDLINKKNVCNFITLKRHSNFSRLLQESRRDNLNNSTSEYIFENYLLEKKAVFLKISSLGIDDQYIVSLTDVTALKNVEKQLQYQAFHDPLTNLPNRMLFLDRLKKAIRKKSLQSQYKYAILFIDLDRFKNINDTLGHHVGDQLLIQTGQKINKCVRKLDTVARFGGDEFVVLLEDVQSNKVCDLVSQRIVREFQDPVTINGTDIYITFSMGILFCSDKLIHESDAIRLADISMYEAKRKGRNKVVYFHEIEDKEIERKLQLEHQLQQAIQKEEIFVQYQPLVNLTTNQLYGLETLVRWNHPEQGILMPDTFIPLAEETGLIISLGQKIFQLAFHDFADWMIQFPQAKGLYLSINLSVKQMLQIDIVEDIGKAASKFKIPFKNVNLEITESIFIDEIEQTARTIQSLKNLGISISINNFGTGYCSLKYLKQFAIDLVKIDKFLIKNIATDETHLDIVASMLNLCKKLDLDVLAEGIENFEQLKRLKNMQCRLGQGYYFFPPLDKIAIEQLLSKQNERG
jgi:diguanylate cyclase (GGDEF)-like protein/PAS domain S-box-containing protein